MEATAKATYVRISPRKVQIVLDLIRNQPADKAMALQYTFSATAVEVTPNAQGRVIIPQNLREFAGIESEALVIGMNNRIEIWSNSKFDDFMASQKDTVAEALSMLRL